MTGEPGADLVRAAYHAFFKREPDPRATYHIKTFFSDGNNDIEGFLNTLWLSYEFRYRVIERLSGDKIINKGGYSLIISLGTHCFTSFLMKYSGLKTQSYPFDWIFSSTKMVTHCINDDFDIFMNDSFHEPVALIDRPNAQDYNKCNHTYYRDNFGINFLFNHHSMDELENVEYFSRCISRLRDAFSSTEATLAVQCFRKQTTEREDFLELSDAIKRRAPNMDLLSISIDESRNDLVMPEFQLIEEDGRNQLYRLRATSALGGIEFGAAIDDLAVLRLMESRGLNIKKSYVPR